MTIERTSYNVGVIIPTGEEFEYVRRSMPFRPISGDKGYWFDFTIPGQRSGVVHVVFDMGPVAAASATGRLLTRFSPEVLALVGIGGALRPKLALGNVVIGSVIQEYMKAAKIVSDPVNGTIIEPSGENWPLAERLRNFTNHFRYFAEGPYRAWLQRAGIRAAEDAIPLTTTPGARREPDYSLLPIASGDFVVADPAFKRWLTSHDRMRSVVEMEAGRVSLASSRSTTRMWRCWCCAASDSPTSEMCLETAAFGGASGKWRRYATQNAFELLMAFLLAPNFPWRESVVTRRPDGEPQASVDDEVDATESAIRRAWDHFVRVAQAVSWPRTWLVAIWRRS